MDKQAIKALFDKAGASIVQDDVWSVQGTPVVKHKALERLAAALRIKYQAPVILRAERDEAVILVTGTIEKPPNAGADPVEWSIGEACVNVNYLVKGKMAAYVYAMAEKRAKDRVILKLAGLHGVYSEEEADEFKSDGCAQADGADSRQGEMTERLMNAEKLIDGSAAKGLESLERIWKQIDPELQPFLKAKVKDLVIKLKAKSNAPSI